MGKLWTKGIVNMENCHVGLQIHDELCLIIREDVLDEKIRQAHDVVCEQYADMLLEVGSTPEVGDNFGSLVEYSVDKD